MVSTLGSQLTQATLTVLVGVIVYVVGRFVESAALQPLAEQRRIIGEVATALTLYAHLYSGQRPRAEHVPALVDPATWEAWVDSESEKYPPAAQTLRELSSRLQGHHLTSPWYGVWARLGLAPSRKRVLEAGAYLIGISAATPPRDDHEVKQNARLRREILEGLGLLKFRTEPPAKPKDTPASPPQVTRT
jgi:hypothetical protein